MEKAITDLFEASYNLRAKQFGIKLDNDDSINDTLTRNLADKAIENLVLFVGEYSDYLSEVKGENEIDTFNFKHLSNFLINCLALKTYARIDLDVIEKIISDFRESFSLEGEFFTSGDLLDRCEKLTKSIQTYNGALPLNDYFLQSKYGKLFIGNKFNSIYSKLILDCVVHLKRIYIAKDNLEEKNKEYASLLLVMNNLMNFLPMNIKTLLNETI
jgi:hypothetical protein